VLPEMAVFPLFSLLFGVSLTVSLLCLYYLFKNWKQDPGHYVVTTFSSILTLFNIIAFVLKSMTTVKHLHVLVCGTEFLPTFQVGEFEASDKFSNVLVPAFLWVTDGFLLYRTWVVWFQRRNFIIIPALVYLASVVCGVAWMVRAVRREFGGVGFNNLDDAAVRWVPALGFSCGMDAIANYDSRAARIPPPLASEARVQLTLTIHISSDYLCRICRTFDIGQNPTPHNSESYIQPNRNSDLCACVEPYRPSKSSGNGRPAFARGYASVGVTIRDPGSEQIDSIQ